MIPLLITVHTSAILNFEAPMCVRDGMCVSFGIGGTILILWIFPQEGVVSVVGACMVSGIRCRVARSAPGQAHLHTMPIQ